MANHNDVKSSESGASGGLVHVIVRLMDGDRVLAGRAVDSDDAHRIAEELLGKFAQADTAWPLLDGRYVRPEAVVSIDVVEEEHRRWVGSAERAKIGDVAERSLRRSK
jgi:hypothetical protein